MGDYSTTCTGSCVRAVYSGPSGDYVMAGSEDPDSTGGADCVCCVHP
jgi:hypothetical protein